ncbi:hypothetical protein ACTWP5_00030 [Streptomyces sp. 4N509B]|uniref:hypothetical protein n=1 Tax=Streptomyces sp. 4N509B TaxID=3457413 RepID=UPI003FCF4359
MNEVLGGGDKEVLRDVAHPWIGQRVVEPRTGRAGRLGLVVEHVRYDVLGRERVLWTEAHLRPVDGSGWEWRADLDKLALPPDRQQHVT